MGGKSVDAPDNPQAEELARIAGRAYTLTDPTLAWLNNRSQNFLAGGLDPAQSALYAPLKVGAEQAYGAGRDALLRTVPAGGALYGALGNLEADKARTLTAGRGQIASDEMLRSMNLASLGLGQGLQGLGTASSLQQTGINQAMSSASQSAAGKGQGAGMLSAAAIMKPRTPAAGAAPLVFGGSLPAFGGSALPFASAAGAGMTDWALLEAALAAGAA